MYGIKNVQNTFESTRFVRNGLTYRVYTRLYGTRNTFCAFEIATVGIEFQVPQNSAGSAYESDPDYDYFFLLNGRSKHVIS